MQTDRINIWLLVAAATGLAAAIFLAIFNMHRGSATLMICVGLVMLGCADRIAAAQHALAGRSHFPLSWKNAKPLQFAFAGAGTALLGITSLLAL
jgi:hypothetical protein